MKILQQCLGMERAHKIKYKLKIDKICLQISSRERFKIQTFFTWKSSKLLEIFSMLTLEFRFNQMSKYEKAFQNKLYMLNCTMNFVVNVILKKSQNWV